MASTFKTHLLSLLHALRIFEDGKLALTNLLMVIIAIAFIRYRDPDWTVLIGLGMILISYNYKRFLANSFAVSKIVFDSSNDEAMKRLSDQVRSIENQIALNSRGF
jgi:hypothetical protein